VPSSALPRAVASDLDVSASGDDTVVYDRSTDVVHLLRAATAQVWQLCDGRTTESAACTTTGLTPDQLHEQIEQLRAVGLIADSEMNRRLMLQRAAAIVGGVAITSVLAPALPAAASGSTGVIIPPTSPVVTVPSAPGFANTTRPNTTDTYTVTVKGGDGGGGAAGTGTLAAGGAGGKGGQGATVRATVQLPPNVLVSVYMGGGGGKGNGTTGTGGAGGNGITGGTGHADVGTTASGGGGGGLSGLFIAGLPVIVAGGGGGGGGGMNAVALVPGTAGTNGTGGGDVTNANTAAAAGTSASSTTGGGGGGAGCGGGAAGTGSSGGSGGGSIWFNNGGAVVTSVTHSAGANGFTAAATHGADGTVSIT
jgi:hypothetical protein